jgi:hypothetical protein
MKPIAWYDPSNGMVSTDRDCPAFTPLGQVWPLYLEEQQITADCPKCEYNKNRAARWRAEAYKQGGHDVIELPWVGLTDEEMQAIVDEQLLVSSINVYFRAIEAKLKEKNCG